MKILKELIIRIRAVPVYGLLKTLQADKRYLIIDELRYWNQITRGKAISDFGILSDLLWRFREYRNLLIYRVGGGKRAMAIKLLYPPLESLIITTKDIGSRLFIQHGIATVIAGKSIGANCWINQQVTIGYTFEKEAPVLGNGVRVGAGSQVLGNIYIADNVIIGAGAVVIKDVPEEEAVVAGVPAKKIGVNKEHKLY